MGKDSKSNVTQDFSTKTESETYPEAEDYDLLVLGTGEGGKYVAWNSAKQGKRVAVVEARWIGGACPNMACLPSKNIIHSAKVASLFFRSEEFGISKNNVRIDMGQVRDRKRRMVAGLVDIHLSNFKASGAELVMGWGRFVAPRTIEVALNAGGTRVLRGQKVVIGTGTRATIEDIPGLRQADPLTHIEALELDVIPEHLIVLGGGYIGLELAQAMRRFGSQVTVVERNARLAHREDDDVSAALQTLFENEGIELALNANLIEVDGRSGEAVRVRLNIAETGKVLEGSHLLVATGRTPNTEGIGLEAAGVALTERGFIQVNEHLQTTAPDTWALGDCVGGPFFTHISYDDHRVVMSSMAGGARVTTNRQVPSCLFTDPELAHIGLSEREAREQGIAYRLFKLPMAAVLRTRTLAETRGFLKAMVGADDRILGFTAFGVDAGEIMAMVQVAMIAGLPCTALRDAVLTHPTLAEGLMVLFSTIPVAGVPATAANAPGPVTGGK